MTLSVTNLGIDGLEDVEQIGTGGSSRVYRARQADLDRIVAVKVLNPGHDQGVSKRFDRERKAMGRLSLHEGIVPVYSSGLSAHGEPYLVMPYYANGSLQDQIDTGAMEWQTAVSYVDVAAETIAAAHDEGVVHLDLKPANILLTNHGAPRIADFGIAKLTGQASSATTGGAAFTPAYSAPETFLDGITGPPSDVYGLGATLWALLVGHPPFLTGGEDTNLMAVIGRVVNNPVGDLRHFTPAPICEVIERAMAKDPENRYQTAREFSLALKNAAAGASPDFQPATGDLGGAALFPGSGGFVYAAGPGGDQEETSMLMRMDPVELPPSIASTAAVPALDYPRQPPSRPLLQETAQPLPRPLGGPSPASPTPFLDLDRFRFGPILFGVLAFLGVIAVSFWALNRIPDTGITDGGDGVTVTQPAGPTAETSTGRSVTPGTGIGGFNNGSTSLTTERSTSLTTATSRPTTASSSTSAATSSTAATSSSTTSTSSSSTTVASSSTTVSSTTTPSTTATTAASSTTATSTASTTATTGPSSSTTAPSSTTTATTEATSSTPPTVAITSTTPSSTSIQVAFTSNQCITRYRVSATGPDNSPVVVANVLSGPACRKNISVAVNGLDPGTVYALSVIVFNSSGLDGRRTGSASTTG